MRYLLLLPILFLLTAEPVFTQEKGQYFLIFSARPPMLKPFSIGGHAFVSWGVGEKDGVVFAEESYGFYPKKGTNIFNAVLLNEPGRLESGFKKNSDGRRLKQLIVRVDRETWQSSLKEAKSWHGAEYNLIKKNCTAFFAELACRAEMKIPCTTNIFDTPRNPVNFIKRLWRKNKKRAVTPYQVRFDPEGIRPNATILGGQ